MNTVDYVLCVLMALCFLVIANQFRTANENEQDALATGQVGTMRRSAILVLVCSSIISSGAFYLIWH